MAKRHASRRDQLAIRLRPGQSIEERIAELEMQGIVANARVALSFGDPFTGVQWSLTECAKAMRNMGDAVSRGDLSDLERMLVSQASALNWIFVAYAARAAGTADSRLADSDAYLRLALRAQGQCRSVVETLQAMKHPRQVAFVGQANIGQNVQVNNGSVPAAAACTASGEMKSPANELLEARRDEQRLDTGAPRASGGGDPSMAAVGTVNGPANGTGKGKMRAQRRQEQGRGNQAGPRVSPSGRHGAA